ncbi:hypothetical protein BDR04DRAFT_1114263 [Suillus decipiens]|nr:hypothetical protein BDR04DRAFT_1114263 [Suillus decipiens]
MNEKEVATLLNITIEEASVDAHSDIETPISIKRACPKPLSKQLLGRSSPKAIIQLLENAKHMKWIRVSHCSRVPWTSEKLLNCEMGTWVKRTGTSESSNSLVMTSDSVSCAVISTYCKDGAMCNFRVNVMCTLHST